jgi:hypothetical protein
MTEQNQLVVAPQVVREEENYVIVQDNEGKFSRKAKFSEYSSITAQTREEKIWLMNLLDGNEETGNGLKDHVGKHIEVANVITRKYDKINEETGQTEYGVLTYLLTPDRIAYVTSSKNVYFSIIRIMDLFGKPNEEGWENVTVKVLKEKGQNGDMIKIKMVG